MTNDDNIIQQVSEINYPGTVDVTDSVMQIIAKRPYLVPQKSQFHWKRWSLGVAATIALCVAINLTILFTRDYNVSFIGSSLCDIYDYHVNYSSDVSSYYSLGAVESLYE